MGGKTIDRHNYPGVGTALWVGALNNDAQLEAVEGDDQSYRIVGDPTEGALLIGADCVPALISHPDVAAVTLTGSTEAGRQVAALAGAALKKTVLELGGSDPYVILKDADLDLAAEACAQGRLVNTGQSCIAAKRMIVVDSVRAEFERRLVARMAARKAG